MRLVENQRACPFDRELIREGQSPPCKVNMASLLARCCWRRESEAPPLHHLNKLTRTTGRPPASLFGYTQYDAVSSTSRLLDERATPPASNSCFLLPQLNIMHELQGGQLEYSYMLPMQDSGELAELFRLPAVIISAARYAASLLRLEASKHIPQLEFRFFLRRLVLFALKSRHPRVLQIFVAEASGTMNQSSLAWEPSKRHPVLRSVSGLALALGLGEMQCAKRFRLIWVLWLGSSSHPALLDNNEL